MEVTIAGLACAIVNALFQTNNFWQMLTVCLLAEIAIEIRNKK